MTENVSENQWRKAHEAAHEVRAAMIALGIPEHEVTTLTARQDASGVMRVAVPSLSLQSVYLMLAGWAPYLGPQHARNHSRGTAGQTAPGMSA